MPRLKTLFADWWPACLMMLTIFILSSQPASVLPVFGWADALVKKGSHVLGYGLLGLAYWRAHHWDRRRLVLSWLTCIAYAAADEFHQAFVAGRHPSAFDVLVFDNLGAALAIWCNSLVVRRA